MKSKAPRSLKCYSCDSSVAHLINQLEGGCSETSKIIEKATDPLSAFSMILGMNRIESDL